MSLKVLITAVLCLLSAIAMAAQDADKRSVSGTVIVPGGEAVERAQRSN